MADSPAFNPPNMQPKDTDPMVSKVDMKNTQWGFREGQAPPMNQEAVPAISHIRNGQ